MSCTQNEDIAPRTWRGLALLLLLICVVYADTLGASWHLDDIGTITSNPGIHVDELTPRALYQSLSAYKGRPVRPVSCLSFALNWRFGRDNVAGWHVVNIAIHVLTAWILFLTILHLFRTPNLKDKTDPRSRYGIALFSAVLWAVNPVQTQAVTYIVQRMTSMAAMFYILGVLCYIEGRLSETPRRRRGFFLACGVSFLLGLGSKENAAMLPIALVFLEFMFFRDLGLPRTRKIFLGVLAGGGILIIILGGALFLRGDPLAALGGYWSRPFTLAERVLTQPRVLLFYLSQLFYPMPHRLSIEHDIHLSTSLLAPWTTLPAILIVLGLIGLGLSLIQRRPLISLAILFFFLNHLLESSIIPLEIVFEHRNYLPSMFLFLPAAAGLNGLMERYRWKSPPMRMILAGFILLLVIGLGLGVRIRNQAWATEQTLWEDAMRKAPRAGRPCHNLANGWFEKIGRLDVAIALYKKAISLGVHERAASPMLLFNLGGLYYALGDYRRAEEWYGRALEAVPNHPLVRERLAMTLLKGGDPGLALEQAEVLVKRHPGRAEYLNLKGLILFKQFRREEALACFRRSIGRRPTFAPGLANAGAALAVTGAAPRARWILDIAHRLDPGEISTRLWRIEAGLRAGDKRRARVEIDRLFTSYSVNRLGSILAQFSGSGVSEAILSAPSPNMLIFHEISFRLRQKSEEMISSDSGSDAR